MELKLRPYQESLVQEIRNAFKAKNRAPLVVLPCGGGKTVLIAYIAREAQKRGNSVLFLVHRKELYDQTVATFSKFNIEMQTIHVGMVQSTANKINSLQKYDLIIFDEAHHSTSATWKKIIDNQEQAKFVGLTATPCRLDGSPLGHIYDCLIIGVTAKYLMQYGFLSEYKYYSPTVADLSELKKRGRDYDMQDAEKLLTKPTIFGNILTNYRSLAGGMQAICYSPTRAYSQKIADLFSENGINAVHFDSETSSRERDKIIQDFRAKKIQILCNVDLISEGFDVPDCECCILLRPTQSTALFIQQAMRALRPSANKPYAVIIDHVANYLKHGLPADDRDWSLDKKIKQKSAHNSDGSLKVRQCTVCFGTFPTASVCPYCGAEYKETAKEIKLRQEIMLKQISERELQAMRELKLQRKRLQERERELKRQRKEKLRASIEPIVSGYSSPEQCRSRYELSIYCKLHGLSNKQFISLAYKLNFMTRKW